MAAKISDAPKRLTEAMKRFCRSIELCDNYLRGYYGLKLVSGFILGGLLLVANFILRPSSSCSMTHP